MQILSSWTVVLISAAVGLTAANLYYAQPIVALIGASLGLRTELAGLVVTLTQAGYGAGVLFLVPLGDILESKKLILSMMGLTILSLLALAFTTTLAPYFIAAFLTGLGASAVQVLVPYTAHFSLPEARGKILGQIMSGLMIGIMLSRPLSSFLTGLFDWHAIFIFSAIAMFFMGIILYRTLPMKEPTHLNLSYAKLLRSMGRLYVETPVLRRRAIYQGFLFCAFCLFWTASPLLLAGPEFHFSHTAIALFALVGVSGAISSPFAGKAADKGYSRLGTIVSLSGAILSFVLGNLLPLGSIGSIALLVVAAILLDAGVTANLVLGQRAIFSLPPEYRSRLNGLYIATIFVGGATGSALGAWAYARGGWTLASICGGVMPLLALIYFLTEREEAL